jgi:hypothetical protein
LRRFLYLEPITREEGLMTTTQGDRTVVCIGVSLIGDTPCGAVGAIGTDTPAPLGPGYVNTF